MTSINSTKTILVGISVMLILAGLIFVKPSVAFAEATFDNPVNKKSQTNCSPFETPTQISGGHNDGKWYCKAKNAPQPGGGVAGGGSTLHQCGDPSSDNAYTPSIDIGCKGIGNPIMDALFGIIHFLSLGVGLVVIGSIIVGGIQYTASRGEPQATALAINRIRASLFALIIYIFAYAALNYIIPGWVLK